jgi:hypothetical protein
LVPFAQKGAICPDRASINSVVNSSPEPLNMIVNGDSKMKFLSLTQKLAGSALMILSLLATPATSAQTVISNETLVSTTFVVNKQDATAKCEKLGCGKKTPLFAPIPVTCPAAIGQTCTSHIWLDTKVETTFPCSGECFGGGPKGFFQFLVDGSAPTIGPTDPNGDYTFESAVFTSSKGPDDIQSRQSYPASVVATVTNSSSSNHTISVSIGCRDIESGGCTATAHWSTMRVDVFEP